MNTLILLVSLLNTGPAIGVTPTDIPVRPPFEIPVDPEPKPPTRQGIPLPQPLVPFAIGKDQKRKNKSEPKHTGTRASSGVDPS